MPAMNIAITLDKNYLQHAAVMLYSLIQHNPEQEMLVYTICDDKIQDADWQKLSEIYKNSKLTVQKVLINVAQFSHFKISDHASYANYYRIQMAQLLPAHVQKVLYMDVDIVIKQSIKELYDTDVTGYYMAAIEDPDNPLKYTLGLKADEPYFNSGIMVINLERWRTTQLNLLLSDFLIKNEAIIQFWDQDAFNVVCKGQWKPLLPKFNVQTFMFFMKEDALTYTLKDVTEAVKNPVILHYTGRSKPWEYMTFHPRKNVYYEYLLQTPWKDFRPADKTIANALRKYKLMPRFIEKIIQKRK